MNGNEKPCCAAEALRRVRQVTVNGHPVGLSMLEECIAQVQSEGLSGENEICSALMKRVKVYNYVPPAAEAAYAVAVMEVYRNTKPGQ